MAAQEQLKTKAGQSICCNGRLSHRRASSQVRVLDASIGRQEWTGMDVQWTQVRNRMSGNGRRRWTAMDAGHGRAPLSKGRPSVPRREEIFDYDAQTDTAHNDPRGLIAHG
jgi:hypothetical protein